MMSELLQENISTQLFALWVISVAAWIVVFVCGSAILKGIFKYDVPYYDKINSIYIKISWVPFLGFWIALIIEEFII